MCQSKFNGGLRCRGHIQSAKNKAINDVFNEMIESNGEEQDLELVHNDEQDASLEEFSQNNNASITRKELIELHYPDHKNPEAVLLIKDASYASDRPGLAKATNFYHNTSEGIKNTLDPESRRELQNNVNEYMELHNLRDKLLFAAANDKDVTNTLRKIDVTKSLDDYSNEEFKDIRTTMEILGHYKDAYAVVHKKFPVENDQRGAPINLKNAIRRTRRDLALNKLEKDFVEDIRKTKFGQSKNDNALKMFSYDSVLHVEATSNALKKFHALEAKTTVLEKTIADKLNVPDKDRDEFLNITKVVPAYYNPENFDSSLTHFKEPKTEVNSLAAKRSNQLKQFVKNNPNNPKVKKLVSAIKNEQLNNFVMESDTLKEFVKAMNKGESDNPAVKTLMNEYNSNKLTEDYKREETKRLDIDSSLTERKARWDLNIRRAEIAEAIRMNPTFFKSLVT